VRGFMPRTRPSGPLSAAVAAKGWPAAGIRGRR
jgi:hypothetical protein